MSKCLCSRCGQLQTYKEITIPIKYGFNDKQHVLIDGIERVCTVCGWHVEDIETTEINRQIALEALKSGHIYKEEKGDTVNASGEAKSESDGETVTDYTSDMTAEVKIA